MRIISARYIPGYVGGKWGQKIGVWVARSWSNCYRTDPEPFGCNLDIAIGAHPRLFADVALRRNKCDAEVDDF